MKRGAFGRLFFIYPKGNDMKQSKDISSKEGLSADPSSSDNASSVELERGHMNVPDTHKTFLPGDAMATRRSDGGFLGRPHGWER